MRAAKFLTAALVAFPAATSQSMWSLQRDVGVRSFAASCVPL